MKLPSRQIVKITLRLNKGKLLQLSSLPSEQHIGGHLNPRPSEASASLETTYLLCKLFTNTQDTRETALVLR
jgi:hypothetical protein